MKRPAVFFDRDNTLIATDGYLGDPSAVVLVPGAAEAVARVRALGYSAVIFSNQSGVARGMFTEEAVHAVNAKVDELLLDQNPAAVIDRHEFCPFHPEAAVERYRQESDLRKPKPGMIFQAAEKLALDLSRSWAIGDAPRDIEAGKAAGCRTILFKDPSLPPSSAANEPTVVEPDFVAASLKEAVDIIDRNRDSQASEEAAAAELLDAPTESTTSQANPAASVVSTTTTATAVPESAPAKPAEPATVASSAAAPARKLTFAERVRAGTYQPATSALSGAAAKPARPTAAAAETPASRVSVEAPAPRTSVEAPTARTAARAEPQPDAPVPVRPTEAYTDTARLEELAQQILDEIHRHREQPFTEFSVSKLMAGIIQVMVAPVLFYAYLHREAPGELQALLLFAIFLQVLTIALLIMGRQR
ncbi:MAG: gmhB [Phycisphaerales bacterium]|nr:gmhB [Phycisphaerales bacterium]